MCVLSGCGEKRLLFIKGSCWVLEVIIELIRADNSSTAGAARKAGRDREAEQSNHWKFVGKIEEEANAA